MAERPVPINEDEELADDAAVRIAVAAAAGTGMPPQASPGPALSLAQLTAGFSPTLRR
ncbi:hypothetical protein DUNSADRAFT_3817 [Dunaliella salina]|uniref:Uncharacterized protein n=1 Tax=Dunaliella salina TaxID=3046 RepID=A0ABQ7FV50_DUNSA|nr:hypothetical protein DUNSADRAFT_3817 [Dunaliella salina]|eukprot:KAF5826270.1 hypothetical protein DUNSADRAFT_3817 [Dunaliella salina]